jgi:MFS family permease
MFSILRHRTYRHLFLAQVVSLAGTGLATVALGLLAFDLAGGQAGAVLGTALAIKMIAYVVIAPLAGAYLSRLPRRAVLVALDVVRVAVVLVFPWVDQIWQIYVLIFALQAASAAFTPLFQASIPEILPDEAQYTRALSLSRLAYDLENLLSPALAASLLLVVSYHGLFLGTALGYLGSALLVVSVVLPRLSAPAAAQGPWRRLSHGARLYLATPRLRGLLALTLAAAAGSAMVIVNTVVIVRDGLSRPESAVAVALAAFGAGSMAVAFALPRWLERRTDRSVMLAAATGMTGVLALLALLWPQVDVGQRWWLLLAGWAVLGATYAALVTPGGRLLRRSARTADWPALFAAQFSLSHACWLLAYPLVGWLGATQGMPTALWAMAGLAALGTTLAVGVWPASDPEQLPHRHDDLPTDHPHWSEHTPDAEGSHSHAFVIDELHTRWPAR